MKRLITAAALIASALLSAACNFNVNEVTPTVEGIDEPINPLPEISETPSTFTPTPSPSVSPTVRAPVVLESPPPLPDQINVTPTDMPLPTPTEGPYIHTVGPGQTLYEIIDIYNYTDFSVIPLVVTLNNLGSADNLREGQQLIIPRQTAQPTAVGFEMTLTAEATRGIVRSGIGGGPTTCYFVQEGDSPIGIASNHGTTLEVLSELNPELGWTGCDFSNPSGGTSCRVAILDIGMCVRVPQPTATPTLSPTPSGNETPTPTPTYAPPLMSSPPDGAIVRGAIMLEWVSAGILRPNESYLVELVELDTASGEPLPDVQPIHEVTRDTAVRLPAIALPTTGAPRLFQWSVIVVAQAESGRYSVIGGRGAPRRFTVNP